MNNILHTELRNYAADRFGSIDNDCINISDGTTTTEFETLRTFKNRIDILRPN